MSRKQLSVLALVVSGLAGCARYSNICRIVDHHYSGDIRQVGTTWHHDKWDSRDANFGYTSDYFENGRLASEKWFHNGRLVRRLAFHESGRLESEERFINGEIDYAAYYDEHGSLKKTVGALPGPEKQAAAETPAQLTSTQP